MDPKEAMSKVNTLSDAILPPQGHWIEDSKKIGPKMQEKALRFS